MEDSRILQNGQPPSEVVYDAPASIFSILEPNSNQSDVPGIRHMTLNRNNLSIASSHPISTEDQRIVLSSDKHHSRILSTEILDGVEQGKQLTKFDWKNQFHHQRLHRKPPVLPFHCHRENHRLIIRRKKHVTASSTLRDIVLIMALLTLGILIVAIFVAVYYGLRSEPVELPSP